MLMYNLLSSGVFCCELGGLCGDLMEALFGAASHKPITCPSDWQGHRLHSDLSHSRLPSQQ
nr:hypothetical protein GCM10017611_14200 [Rhodococcus wratislaviensis]